MKKNNAKNSSSKKPAKVDDKLLLVQEHFLKLQQQHEASFHEVVMQAMRGVEMLEAAVRARRASLVLGRETISEMISWCDNEGRSYRGNTEKGLQTSVLHLIEMRDLTEATREGVAVVASMVRAVVGEYERIKAVAHPLVGVRCLRSASRRFSASSSLEECRQWKVVLSFAENMGGAAELARVAKIDPADNEVNFSYSADTCRWVYQTSGGAMVVGYTFVEGK